MKVENVKKYIPKELQKHIVGKIDIWKNDGEHYYCIDIGFDILDKNGEQISFVAHGIDELKWACKQILNRLQ